MPFTAGSATDITARTVVDQVGRQIGQTFVVENRGGAGTTLGSNIVAKADPDGYTILVSSTSMVVVASTYANLPYSVTDDFVAGRRARRHSLFRRHGGEVQNPERADRNRQKARRQHPLRHRRRGQLRPPVHGAVAARRRISGQPRAVPRNAGGDDRDGRRPPRHVSDAGRKRHPALPRRQDQHARRELAEAAADHAGGRNASRAWPARRRIPVLGRRLCARQNAEADRRAAQPRDRRGAERERSRRQDPCARRNADADDAAGVRSLREGSRSSSTPRSSRRPA